MMAVVSEPVKPASTEMLRKVAPSAPIAVLEILTAVLFKAVVAPMVLATAAPPAQSLVTQTFTVPPLLAVKAGFAPVSSARPPRKVIVAPLFWSLLSRKIPLPSSSMAPLKTILLAGAAAGVGYFHRAPAVVVNGSGVSNVATRRVNINGHSTRIGRLTRHWP